MIADGYGHPGHGNQPQSLELAKTFSGKLEPLLAAGLKIGDYALRKLQADKYSLRVTIEAKLLPPQSYLLDGLQIATGATLGNGQLQLQTAEHFQVTFESIAQDKGKLTLTLAENFNQDLQKWLQEWGDPEIVALYIYNLHPVEQIVTETATP
jgi:formylmethanofuran dehydrogenase subunit E